MLHSTQGRLAEMCRFLRRALDPGLPGFASGNPNSAGACLYAAVMVRASLLKFGEVDAIIRGGGHGDGGGALDTSGAWRGHYWVEVFTPEGEQFVVDVTADQFGYDRVVVLPIELSRVRYRPGEQSAVDEAAIEIEKEIS